MINREVVVRVDNIDITGRLYLPGNKRTPYPTVCICHGIPSGNSPDPGDGGYPLLAEKICKRGFAVFIFNFRGTGNSGGNLELYGWTRDLKVVIDYLYGCTEVDRARLALLGFSGGAAVSVCVASADKRVSAVIACACPAEFGFVDPTSIIERFRSIGVFRDKDFPGSVEEWAENFRKVSPIDYVSGIAPRPLLLVHGDADETVDISHAYRLYDKAGEPREIIVIPGAGHKLRRNDTAMGIVFDWLESWSSA